MSPFLFLIYINDLLEKIHKLNEDWIANAPDINSNMFWEFIGQGTKAYADDILIKFYNLRHLRDIIKLIEEWAQENKIEINKGNGKSHIMYLNNLDKKLPRYTVANITPVGEYKYLGIKIQANGKFTRELELITAKIGNFKKYQLLNKARLSIHTTKIFISAYIQSKFLYHVLIYDHLTENQKETLEGMFSQATKKALKFPKFTKRKQI